MNEIKTIQKTYTMKTH